ncbi:MAG TPA: hypothetical protein VE053_10965 [Allosphingosinicella sp.]|nr:hypothetical protein [Allosphingosinicella sp.]
MRRARLAAKMRMTEREYRANIDGLNIFFGAVLGFVLAGSETLDNVWFGVLLAMTAGIVISILYITASVRRLTYSIVALFLIVSMSSWLEDFLPGTNSIPAKLQPCLLVWVLLTIAVEFLPRDRAEADTITAA